MVKELKISFLGDICPVNRVEEALLNNDFSNFRAIRKILINQDLVIANLECPLTESHEKIRKIGPNLKGHPKSVNLLKYLNIGITALANNHILDYGHTGFSDTIKLLKENDIEFVGAGLNVNEASTPLLKTINGITICIINVCEREFNIAGTNTAGANPFDIVSIIRDIRKYRDKVDFIILYYHGGIEYYNLPTPEMFKNFGFLAKAGIDIIVCNHQHVLSGYQKQSGSHIFYGLGNFIFDWGSMRNNQWNYGIILNLTLRDKKAESFEIVPYEQCNSTSGLVLNSSISEKVFKELDILNSKLTEDSIEKEWGKFVSQNNTNLLGELFIQNKYLRYLLKKTGLIRGLITKGHKRRLFNYFNCQSHSEFARDSLKEGLNRLQ